MSTSWAFCKQVAFPSGLSCPRLGCTGCGGVEETGCHRSLLCLCGRCCTGSRLSSCSGVAFPPYVLQEERFVSLKIAVGRDLKEMNHFNHRVGEEPFLAALLPTTIPALPNCGDKVSSFLAGYEVLENVLPRAPLGSVSLEVLLVVPDIKWPLRIWSHPCGSCLRGFVEHERPCFLLFP